MAQNYYRLATLLIDYGSKILTEYLEYHCEYKDLQDLLNGEKHNLHHSSYPEHKGNCCCNLKIKVKRYKITKAQFDALFDNVGALPPCGRSGTHYCCFKPKTPITLDITLASLLIVNTIPTLSTTDSAAVDEIRKLRNSVAHSAETSISDQEFELKWCASRDNILHLARTLPQPFATEMKNDIDGLKTKSMVLKNIRDTDSLLEEIKSGVQGAKGAVLEKLWEVKSDVHQIKDLFKCWQKGVQQMKGIQQELLLIQLIENTAMMLQKHRKKMYVSHKRAMEASYEGLCKDRHITITGRGGEGKTSLGTELMDKVCNEQTDDEQRYTPVILDKADDFDLINGKDHLVILIDDPFGKSNTDKQRLEEWERRFEKMSSFIKEGKIFIILCIRSYILKGIDEKLRGVEFLREEKSVNLSGKFRLDLNEKYDMLKAYEQAQSSDSTGANKINETILREVSLSNPSLGFPQSCHLFFSSKHICDNILDFFNQPERSLQKDIYNVKKSDPTQYMVLVFMLLEGGLFNLDKLDTDKLEMLCELTKMHSVDVGDITECVLYGNVYIEQVDTTPVKLYEFTHQTILESVLLSFCRTYPEVFLQLGEDDMILDFARPAGYKGVPGEVCVILPESCHRQLAKRFASILYAPYRIIGRCLYTDKSFVKNLIDVIESENMNLFKED